MRVATLVVVMVLASCATASARGFKWWQSPAIQHDMQLTAQQVATIDALFNATLAERKAVREQLDYLDKAVKHLLDDPGPDEAAGDALIDRLEETRAHGNVLRRMMIYRIRRVLTADQRAWFDTHADAAAATH
jgi:Spy/CpxP family protein refolding chaperone